MTTGFEKFLLESEASTNTTIDPAKGSTDNIATRGSRMDLGADGHGSENHIAKRKPLVDEGDPYDDKLTRLKKRRDPDG